MTEKGEMIHTVHSQVLETVSVLVAFAGMRTVHVAIERVAFMYSVLSGESSSTQRTCSTCCGSVNGLCGAQQAGNG